MVETLGKKLKKLRESQALKQSQVASLLNVTRSTICTYENDTRQPPYDILIKIADLYHVSTDYLLGHQIANILDLSELDAKDAEFIRYMFSLMKNKK